MSSGTWTLSKKNVSLALRIQPKLRVNAILSIVFAPIALVMPYDTIEDAIEIANESRFALGASVFGPEKYECLDVAKKLHCGMVSINDFGVFYVCSYTRRFARVFLLTRSPVEVRQTTVDMRCMVFTPSFLLIAKISPSEEQRPVATEDLVSVVSLSFMLGN
jgi:hypothetical protein